MARGVKTLRERGLGNKKKLYLKMLKKLECKAFRIGNRPAEPKKEKIRIVPTTKSDKKLQGSG